MSLTLEALTDEVLRLAPDDRSKLIRKIVASLDDVPQPDTASEAIAAAWDEEIARRVANMDAGRTHWIPSDVVIGDLRAKISAAKAAHATHAG